MRGWLAIVLGLLGLLAGWLCNAGKPPAPAASPPATVQPAPAAARAAAVVAGRVEPDGRLVLEGTVPDAAARESLVVAARRSHGPDEVIDRVVLDERVGPLAVFTLRGDVASEGVRGKLMEGLRAALPGVRIDDQLRVPPRLVQEERIRAVLEGRRIEFAPGSAELTAAGAGLLDRIVPLILAEASTRIEVQGHTDSTGDAAWNRQLSQSRAESTRAYLLRKGVPADRLTARGYGDAQPVADNTTPEGRQQNRRIAFDVEGN